VAETVREAVREFLEKQKNLSLNSCPMEKHLSPHKFSNLLFSCGLMKVYQKSGGIKRLSS
jgi:hypothetical protein